MDTKGNFIADKEVMYLCNSLNYQKVKEIENKEEHNFKSDRLYLYYTQKGRCMYCGRQIKLESLWDENKYDIDHIYPQSKVMDDSLNNRVLTCKTCNANKTDIYPLRAEIREKMQPLWKTLLDKKFIEKEKYNRPQNVQERGRGTSAVSPLPQAWLCGNKQERQGCLQKKQESE